VNDLVVGWSSSTLVAVLSHHVEVIVFGCDSMVDNCTILGVADTTISCSEELLTDLAVYTNICNRRRRFFVDEIETFE